MAWGGYQGGGKGAREVAAAFYAGRRLRRGNARTDGRTYWLFDNAIARRVPEDDILETVTRQLTHGDAPRLLEFSWAGWCTPTTESHLDALGVPMAWKGSENTREPRQPEICGKPVDPHGWYTLEEAAALPAYEQPTKRKQTRFVNMTLPLFG